MAENIFYHGGKLDNHTIVAALAICWNVARYTRPLLLQSSVLALDMVPSLTLTDAHLPGSLHLFIYLFICVMFIY